MDDELQRYLNDHLGGSAGAVDLIRSLAERGGESIDRLFFEELESKVEHDREQLKELIARLGGSSSDLLEAAGNLTAKAGKLKLEWEGFEPGSLGMMEALEILSLGIEGKRLLWVLLAKLAPSIPEWREIDFAWLEREAAEQRDAVEERRLKAGLEALLDGRRGSGHEDPVLLHEALDS